MNDQATTILSIEAVELYQWMNQNANLISSGPLTIVFHLANNTFALKAKNFSYTLSKDVTIFAAPPKLGDSYPSYTISDRDFDLIIKIVKIASPEALSRFETVLNNNCNLSYKDQPGEAVPVSGRQENPPNDEFAFSEEDNKASKVITKVGELIRTGLIKSAEFLSRGIIKFGSFIQNKWTSEKRETVVEPSTITKLEKADSATNKISNFAQDLVLKIFYCDINR